MTGKDYMDLTIAHSCGEIFIKIIRIGAEVLEVVVRHFALVGAPLADDELTADAVVVVNDIS